MAVSDDKQPCQNSGDKQTVVVRNKKGKKTGYIKFESSRDKQTVVVSNVCVAADARTIVPDMRRKAFR
jgi:hypothetical protein